MTLDQGEVLKEYKVSDVNLPDAVMRRLEALGIFEGTHLKILNKKKQGAMIIKVRGARWALGKQMTLGIDVEAYSDEKDN